MIKEYLLYDMATYRGEALEALRNVQITEGQVRSCGNMLGNARGGGGKGKLSCKRFFNRLGGLHVRIQQNIYEHFKQQYDALVDEAKATHKYHGVAGVLNSYYDSVTYNESLFDKGANEVVHTSDVGGVTRMVHLQCDAGMSFEEAYEELQKSTRLTKTYIEEERVNQETGHRDGFYWWSPNNSDKNKQEVVLVIEKPQLQISARHAWHSSTRGVRVLTPHRGGNTYRVGNVLGWDSWRDKSAMPSVTQVVSEWWWWVGGGVGLVVGLLVVARFGVFFDLFKYLHCQTSLYSAVQERGKSTGRLHSIDHRKYQKVVKKLWNAQYDLALMKCSTCASCRLKDHEPKKKSMDDPLWKCTPSRNVNKTLVCGCILQLWDVYKPSVAALAKGRWR